MDEREYNYTKVDQDDMEAYLDFALSSSDEESAKAIEAVYLG